MGGYGRNPGSLTPEWALSCFSLPLLPYPTPVWSKTTCFGRRGVGASRRLTETGLSLGRFSLLRARDPRDDGGALE